MNFLKIWLITVPIFFAIDMVWLVVVAKSFYAKHIGFLLAPEVNWMAAILFYLLFVAGLVFFVIQPALQKESLLYAALSGAFFGFITYATYDLTNLATVKDWPLLVTIVDLAWGTILGSAVSSASYYLSLQWLRG